MAELLVKNLTVGYDKPILRDVSFSLQPGELAAVIGRNGCGKTTLLRGLTGSVRRFSGEVFVHGADIARLNTRQAAKYLSYLPQHTEIMEGILAREVIAMGRYPYGSVFQTAKADANTLRAAQTLGISHFLNEDCGRLSQGQRQLVLLARLLNQNTPLMLLDEPNNALDHDNASVLFHILRTEVREQNKAALLILHDPELALRHCDRLLLIHNGALCADLSVADADLSQLEQALRQLYPAMRLRIDPFDGTIRTYLEEHEEK